MKHLKDIEAEGAGIPQAVSAAESEALYGALLEMSPFPISITTLADSRILNANKTYCKIAGHRCLDDLIGRTLDELGFHADPEERRQIHALLQRDGEIKNLQTRVQRGGVVPANLSLWIKKIRYRGQDCALIMYWFSSPEMEVQKALRDSDTRFHILLNSINESYYEVDLDGRLTFFNDSLSTLLGHRKGAIKGVTFQSHTSDEDASKIGQAYKEVGSNDRKINYIEFGLRHQKGHTLQVEASVSLLRGVGGTPIGYYGIIRDRTEQKKAEEALRRSEEKHRRILEEMEEGYYEVDLKGNYTYFNEAIARILGYPPEELMGMNYHQYLAAGQAEEISQVFNTIFKTGNSAHISDYEIIRKDGSICISDLSAYPLKNQQGDIVGFWGISRDRTQQKKTEDRLMQAQKMEAVGTLAGGIAHDFNNILYGILGFAELALDDTQRGSVLEDNLKEVINASKRAKDLVRQILAFARQSEEKVEPMTVSPIVKEALKLIRSSLPSTIEIQSNIVSRSLSLGNPTQMHQIVMNLCTNAAHAMETSGGILSIGLEDIHLEHKDGDNLLGLAEGDYLKLTVSDTGCGIPPDIIHTIFEPYFTTKPLGEGTGMGLSVVQGIVENYGGKITVQSVLGQGSTFLVYLPIIQGNIRTAVERVETQSARSEHILFVDDEPSLIKMGGLLLERLGYRVTTRTSSLEALKLFRAQPHDFDLVITDMTMPQMTGDHLASELMRIRPDIPVIVCTGYSKKMDEELAAEIGIRAFIYKPLQKSELAGTIRKVLKINQNGSI